MRKPAVLMGLVIGAGVTVCTPEIRAYRRLSGIARVLREDQPIDDATSTIATARGGRRRRPGRPR